MIGLVDIGWVAGFMEGEGSFMGGSSFSVSAGQKTREPLERLQSLLGGTITFDPKHHRSGMHRWGTSGSRAVGIALTLYPLMSARRRVQIENALVHWKAMRKRREVVTAAEIQQMAVLRSNGTSWDEIANQFGLSTGSASNAFYRAQKRHD